MHLFLTGHIVHLARIPALLLLLILVLVLLLFLIQARVQRRPLGGATLYLSALSSPRSAGERENGKWPVLARRSRQRKKPQIDSAPLEKSLQDANLRTTIFGLPSLARYVQSLLCTYVSSTLHAAMWNLTV